MSDEPQESPWPARLRKLAMPALGVAVVGVLVFAIMLLLGKKEAPRRAVSSVVQLKLITPPPPPPPPPPPKVEPPKLKTPELKVEQPTPQAPSPTPKNDSPPALDAQGTGPGDAFGLEGRPGGTGWGQGGGGGGSLAAWYAAQINQRVHEEVVRRGGRRAGVQALLQLWISPEGQLERVNVVESSGRAEYDQLLVDSVRAVALPKPPPGLKQPQWYRFGHRNSGGGLAG